MRYTVVKSGMPMLDALHAYGLGIFLAYASRSSVRLEDAGIAYNLQHVGAVPSNFMETTIDKVLALPRLEEIRKSMVIRGHITTRLATLDGLLAALFTTPGARVLSLNDLTFKEGLNKNAVRLALVKVTTARSRLKAIFTKHLDSFENQGHDLLRDYIQAHPALPSPAYTPENGMSIPLTVDPAFSYSTRKPISDGFVADKINLTLIRPHLASTFAMIGAARFLRAQRVASNLVNFYVPIPGSIVLTAGTALSLLTSIGQCSKQALALRFLSMLSDAKSLNADWSSLAFQVLQTQGVQQSISIRRGIVDLEWLSKVEKRAGRGVLDYWKMLFAQPQERLDFEIDNLVDCLLQRSTQSWVGHLKDQAISLGRTLEKPRRRYSLNEVREVCSVMDGRTISPLSSVLEREQGTLRFGHALRLVGRFNPSALRDLVDLLDSVQNIEQLMRVLASAAQECMIAHAKTEFIIIPDDDDLKLLLDDVDRFGVKRIANLLIILGSLRYPRNQEGSDDSTSHSHGEMKQAEA